jgi:hypothetical protein
MARFKEKIQAQVLQEERKHRNEIHKLKSERAELLYQGLDDGQRSGKLQQR